MPRSRSSLIISPHSNDDHRDPPMKRRSFLQSSSALGLLGLGACATTSIPTSARVVVVGGGYGGATAAKYVRMLSDHKVDVVLIEPNEAFVSCPISNLVVGGSKQMADITTPYTALARNHQVGDGTGDEGFVRFDKDHVDLVV